MEGGCERIKGKSSGGMESAYNNHQHTPTSISIYSTYDDLTRQFLISSRSLRDITSIFIICIDFLVGIRGALAAAFTLRINKSVLLTPLLVSS